MLKKSNQVEVGNAFSIIAKPGDFDDKVLSSIAHASRVGTWNDWVEEAL